MEVMDGAERLEYEKILKVWKGPLCSLSVLKEKITMQSSVEAVGAQDMQWYQGPSLPRSWVKVHPIPGQCPAVDKRHMREVKVINDKLSGPPEFFYQ